MKNLLACPFQKILPIASGQHDTWAFGEQSMVPALLQWEKLLLWCHCRGNLLSGHRLCNLPSPTLSYWRVQKPFNGHADVLLVERSGFWPGVFSSYLPFFLLGLSRAEQIQTAEPIAPVTILAVKMFFHVQRKPMRCGTISAMAMLTLPGFFLAHSLSTLHPLCPWAFCPSFCQNLYAWSSTLFLNKPFPIKSH